MVGELTVTIVGTYATLALAVAAWDLGTDPAVTDHHEIVVLPGGQGSDSYALIKVVRA